MSHHYLSRDDAPFGDRVWEALDRIMLQTAKSVLTGRRMIHVSGPHGLGMKSLAFGDAEVEPGVLASSAVPLFYLYRTFTVSKRDLAQFEKEGIAPPATDLAGAVTGCAMSEDELIFHGKQGSAGLLNVKGNQKAALSSWDKVGAAAGDVINAVTRLDEAGFHGPYALALSPARYNLLFRMYERGNTSEMEHLKTLVTDGVFKAPVLKKGGVLMNTGRGIATLLVGQDMSLGFHGPADGAMEFAVSESIALGVHQPGAVCVLAE